MLEGVGPLGTAVCYFSVVSGFMAGTACLLAAQRPV